MHRPLQDMETVDQLLKYMATSAVWVAYYIIGIGYLLRYGLIGLLFYLHT